MCVAQTSTAGLTGLCSLPEVVGKNRLSLCSPTSGGRSPAGPFFPLQRWQRCISATPLTPSAMALPSDLLGLSVPLLKTVVIILGPSGSSGLLSLSQGQLANHLSSTCSFNAPRPGNKHSQVFRVRMWSGRGVWFWHHHMLRMDVFISSLFFSLFPFLVKRLISILCLVTSVGHLETSLILPSSSVPQFNPLPSSV